MKLQEIRKRVDTFTEGLSPPKHSVEGVRDLLFQLSYRSQPGETPPPHVLHIEQTSLVTELLLQHMDPAIKRHGLAKAYGHDLGRSITQDAEHTIAGAKILRHFGFDERLVIFSLSHHHWGLSFKSLNNFSMEVSSAMKNGTLTRLVDAVAAQDGIDIFAVLLADNSKRNISKNPIITEITPFTEQLGQELIEAQIERGRYEKGSSTHAMEKLGANFLVSIIPYLERRLWIDYTAVIAEARMMWPNRREEVIAKWETIHYDEGHGKTIQ